MSGYFCDRSIYLAEENLFNIRVGRGYRVETNRASYTFDRAMNKSVIGHSSVGSFFVYNIIYEDHILKSFWSGKEKAIFVGKIRFTSRSESSSRKFNTLVPAFVYKRLQARNFSIDVRYIIIIIIIDFILYL